MKSNPNQRGRAHQRIRRVWSKKPHADGRRLFGFAARVILHAEAMLGKSTPIDNARSVLRTTLTRLHFISGLPTMVFLRAQRSEFPLDLRVGCQTNAAGVYRVIPLGLLKGFPRN